MNKTIATIFAIALLLPSAALAQGVEFYFDGGGPRYGDRPRYYDDDYRDNRFRQRTCSPRRALAIARAQGLPRARIGRTTNRWIEIRGRGSQSIVFGLSPRCPILGYND
jgi:hypothetical protein